MTAVVTDSNQSGEIESIRAEQPLMPIERLGQISHQIPQALSGCYGANRADVQPQIAAENDLQAVQSWLVEYQASPETFRSYRREAERLLLWCWYQQGKALSDLNRADIQAYQNFLKQPEPAAYWCGESRNRHSDQWRPFKAGLSAASQRQALTVLKGLFSYLRDADYLRGNPFALIRQAARDNKTSSNRPPIVKTERYLEQDDIRLMFERYQNSPLTAPERSGPGTPQGNNAADSKAFREWMREKTLLCFLYYLAPRASEVAACRMGDFFQRRGLWWWRVLGKGNKYAEVPVPDLLMNQIRQYRHYLQLPPDPEPDEDTAFIRSTRGNRGISANMVYRLSKKILNDTADHIEAEHPQAASRMRQASTHWFRHTAITHLADQGVDLRLVSKTARHSQLQTTAIYFHAEDEAWHDAVSRANQVTARNPDHKKRDPL